MLKEKYLHRKLRLSSYKNTWKLKKFNRSKNIDFFSELPMRENIKKRSYHNGIDFRPVEEFIESKIGQPWDDVYSEICKKIKKKYRYMLDNFMFSWYGYFVYFNPIYDEEFIPRSNYGRMLKDCFYVDLDGILVKKTQEELLNDSKKYLRRKKLLEIIENQENEQKMNDQELSS